MEPGKAISLRRCAIYTRKSSEEGLEQDFNSLHAQREACEAFVKSQAGEGWRLLKTAFDDGGFSGGTMERPALKRLLADIAAGLVDVVVVYKVDRLTRSLGDFAKMVEAFDAHAVSFVAVTQQFNTTTSMGRLTLNVLLSFAQFEREVTGERIRDKIAASKRKGLWMGGVPPLGYDVCDRQLVVNRAEAATVKLIFERYLALGSVRLLKHELDRRRIISKVRVSRKGKRSGGQPFSRGALYELLSNPVYIGQVRHGRQVHPGQHPPILERSLWERVQQHLGERAARGQKRRTMAPPSPLAGKLYDENGQPLYAQGAAKANRRYRYYVSRDLVRGSAKRVRSGWRIAALELERAVVAVAKSFLEDQPAVLAALQESEIEVADVRQVFELAADWSRRLLSGTEGPCSPERVGRKSGTHRKWHSRQLPGSAPAWRRRDGCQDSEGISLRAHQTEAARCRAAAHSRRQGRSAEEGRPGAAQGRGARPAVVRRDHFRPCPLVCRGRQARRVAEGLRGSADATRVSVPGHRRRRGRGPLASRAKPANAHDQTGRTANVLEGSGATIRRVRLS